MPKFIKNTIKFIKLRRFKRLVRKQDDIVLFWYVMKVISVRWSVVTVKLMRDDRVENIKLSQVVIKHKGKDVRLSNIGLFSY